jgi:DNA-binding NtrC family response regulator
MAKRILIIDEDGFSRVCSELLKTDGFETETAAAEEDCSPLLERINNNGIELIITSYPYGASFFEPLKKTRLPIIILFDHFHKEIMNILKVFERPCCMIKPLDYQKFRTVVKDIVNGDMQVKEGYNIV